MKMKVLLILAMAAVHVCAADSDINGVLADFAGIDVDEVRTNETLQVNIKKPIGPFNRAVIGIDFDGTVHQILCHAYFPDMVQLPWTVSQMEALKPDLRKHFDCELTGVETNGSDSVRWTYRMRRSEDWTLEVTAIQMKRKGNLPSSNLATLSIHRESCIRKYDVPNESEKVAVPKAPPKGDIGEGQGEKWVRATFPADADMILKKGYETWLMEWVGVMRQNGHYKEMVHVDPLAEKSVELYCGPYRVHVTKPGTYSFPLEVFAKYPLRTEPKMELTFDTDDGFRTKEWFYRQAQEATKGGVR